MTQARTFRQIRFRPPPGAAELVLVRHGESQPLVEDQPFDLVDGHGDPPLSAEGREQAAKVCARLAGERIDAIYVSTLRRTSETAADLAASLGIEPIVERDLREVFLGDWEGGIYRQRMSEGGPIAQRVFLEERWDVIPNAEPAEALEARTRGVVEKIAAKHLDQRVAVFAHGGIIGSMLALASGSRPFAFAGADNASISHLVVMPGRWVVRRFNDTTHLDPALTVRPAALT